LEGTLAEFTLAFFFFLIVTVAATFTARLLPLLAKLTDISLRSQCVRTSAAESVTYENLFDRISPKWAMTRNYRYPSLKEMAFPTGSLRFFSHASGRLGRLVTLKFDQSNVSRTFGLLRIPCLLHK